jgi:hypothetical protein
MDGFKRMKKVGKNDVVKRFEHHINRNEINMLNTYQSNELTKANSIDRYSEIYFKGNNPIGYYSIYNKVFEDILDSSLSTTEMFALFIMIFDFCGNISSQRQIDNYKFDTNNLPFDHKKLGYYKSRVIKKIKDGKVDFNFISSVGRGVIIFDKNKICVSNRGDNPFNENSIVLSHSFRWFILNDVIKYTDNPAVVLFIILLYYETMRFRRWGVYEDNVLCYFKQKRYINDIKDSYNNRDSIYYLKDFKDDTYRILFLDLRSIDNRYINNKIIRGSYIELVYDDNDVLFCVYISNDLYADTYVIERKHYKHLENISGIFKMNSKSRKNVIDIIRKNLSSDATGKHFGVQLIPYDEFYERVSLEEDKFITEIDIEYLYDEHNEPDETNELNELVEELIDTEEVSVDQQFRDRTKNLKL